MSNDLAALAVEQGQSGQNAVIEAVGTETFTYRQLIQQIGTLIGCPRPAVSVPKWLGYAMATLLGKIMGDILVTREEIEGLTAGLLYVDGPAAGQTRLTEWVRQHADTLGCRYASELARRRDRQRGYGKL